MLFNKYLSEIILCSELFYTRSAWSQIHILRHLKHLKKVEITFLPKDSNPLIWESVLGLTGRFGALVTYLTSVLKWVYFKQTSNIISSNCVTSQAYLTYLDAWVQCTTWRNHLKQQNETNVRAFLFKFKIKNTDLAWNIVTVMLSRNTIYLAGLHKHNCWAMLPQSEWQKCKQYLPGII